jgi:hypothetical protein
MIIIIIIIVMLKPETCIKSMVWAGHVARMKGET